jgi:hypothetical protein
MRRPVAANWILSRCSIQPVTCSLQAVVEVGGIAKEDALQTTQIEKKVGSLPCLEWIVDT